MYWNCTVDIVEIISKSWLTLTWDVLKYTEEYGIVHCGGGLTLTWDVLKSKYLC